MTVTETNSTDAWGVTVEQVVAVASQADVRLDTDDNGDVTTPPSNPVFQKAPQIAQRITRTQVETWIGRVAAWVSTRLYRRHRLRPARRAEFEQAMATAVEVGAAAYLVDAAYPQRTGVQDQASYGQVLWNRYRQALADLEEALGDQLRDPDDDNGAGSLAGGADGFPPAIFTDEWVRENSSQTARPSRAGVAPGAEHPVGW